MAPTIQECTDIANRGNLLLNEKMEALLPGYHVYVEYHVVPHAYAVYVYANGTPSGRKCGLPLPFLVEPTVMMPEFHATLDNACTGIAEDVKEALPLNADSLYEEPGEMSRAAS